MRLIQSLDTPRHGLVGDSGTSVPVADLGEIERRKVLWEWNRTAAETPAKCLHDLIEEQVERWPDRMAVVSDDLSLSYREFNSRANQLAHELHSRGIGPGKRVAICLGHSAAFAVAVLGTLKSGAACVPLDPDYPKDRLAYMLNDSQASVVITQEDSRPDGIPPGCAVLLLEEPRPGVNAFSAYPTSNVERETTPESIAYVIYSSGSTGQPKGVLIKHSGLVNYNYHAARTYGMTPDDRVLQFCSVSFDIALEEIFITWFSGATLVFRTDSVPVAVPEFLAWIEQHKITVLDLPTAYWHEWVHEFPQLKGKVVPKGLRLVIVGGEKPSSQAYAKWLPAAGKRVRWINTYGPTEISICATAYEPKWNSISEVPENIPIGRPLANARVYLLDSSLNPVPVGETGELHVAGAGVARGYLNRPELTAQKFIPDPFSADPDARLYKTGDLARHLPSGDIEFLGRSDDQIKIRGFRIELGEIENALSKYPGVREAVVAAREDVPGDKQLVAYVIPTSNARLDSSELRRFLKQQLPDYMVPAAFVELQSLPMTPNGKVDRRGLPAPSTSAPSAAFVMATDPIEKQLVALWEEILNRRPIGIRDNFFELGGHSLLAARLMHRTGQAFGQRLPLAMLFHAPTIERLAGVLRQDEWSHHWSSLVPIQPAGSQPPFFCIHGIGGNVLGFHRLGRCMAPDYPFYGLQSKGMDGKQPCLKSIEAMAAHYISEMRSVQPHGPYFIGGFSFGGLVGYEIAQQLRKSGEETVLLVLFDTYPGDVQNGTSSFFRLLFNPSRQNWFHDVSRALDKKVRRTWRTLQVPQIFRDIHAANRMAASQYVLRPYAGKVTLVRATDKAVAGAPDPHGAWKGLAGSLAEHEINSDHYDILLEPQVNDLAAQLKTWIGEAKAEYEKSATALQVS